MSKRKSPALVGIVNGERLLGEEAFSFAVRYPESIFQRARDLLGKDPDDPTILAMLEEHGLPYKVVSHPKRGVASLQLGEGDAYSPEELVGSILYYARQIAEAQAGGPVTDAVVAVPAFFGQRQRQALADAAGLAGINLMGLINSHTAAALQYGIERDFTNRSQTILLYDMGSGTTEVALVKYSTYTVKEAGKPKVYNQLEVRDVDWDASLGSNLLDMALAKHFAAEFSERAKLPGVDVMALPKAMAKLRRQVRRTKEMLSANTAAPCTVEELYDGKDFQSSITREQFESLAADFFSRAAAPLRRILERNNLQPADVDAVELLGGGSRVPRLQAALSEVLGGRSLDRHLDADEAIALGAGLFAANLSTSFRLRKFGMVDTTMYGVSLSLDHVVLGAPAADGAVAVEGEALAAGSEPLQKLRNLLPYNKKLPTKRVVKLEGLAADPLRFSLAYNASTPHGLPPGVRAPELGEWEASGVEAVMQRYNTSGQVSIRFEADYGGLLRLDKVEAVVEYEVMEEKIIEVPLNETEAGAEGGAGAAEGESSFAEGAEKAAAGDGDADKMEDTKAGDADIDAADNGGPADAAEGAEAEGEEKAAEAEGGNGGGEQPERSEKLEEEAGEAGAEAKEGEAKEGEAKEGADAKAKPATTVKRIQVPKTKVAKVPLTLGGRGWLAPPLAGEELKEAGAVLARFAAAEAVKREVAKARNDLESYIIAMKEALETDELMQKVSTEELRDSFRARLTEEEDWLYMEADEGEGAQQFRDRHKQLRDIGEPIKRRAEEMEMRPKVVEGLRRQIELKRATAKAWADTKPWIEEADREGILQQITELEADMEAKLTAQAAKADHEDPAFTVNELAAGWEKLDKAFTKLNNKKKPKPPPEPPKPAAGAEGEAGADKAEGGDAGAKADADSDAPKADANASESADGASKRESAGGSEQSAQDDTKEEPEKAEEEAKAKDSKKEEPKKDAKGKKPDPKKDSKAKKEEPKKGAKGKEEPKKDSKAKKEAPKKEAPKKEAPKKEAPKKEAPKEAPKKDDGKKDAKGPDSQGAGKKDEKKGWSWNKKGKAEL